MTKRIYLALVGFVAILSIIFVYRMVFVGSLVYENIICDEVTVTDNMIKISGNVYNNLVYSRCEYEWDVARHAK